MKAAGLPDNGVRVQNSAANVIKCVVNQLWLPRSPERAERKPTMKSIGMDLHQKQTVFHVLSEDGLCVGRGRIDTTAEALEGLIKKYSGEGVQVAIEASTPAFWVREVLVKAGARVEVTNPYKLRLIAESRNKTDANDAMILADLLRCGGLPREVYVPSLAIRQLRECLALRRSLIQMRTKIICSAKAALRRRGLRYNARSFHTSSSWGIHVEEVAVLETLQSMYHRCEEERLKLEKSISENWGGDPVIMRLKSIPGVGPLVAVTILAAIGEIERFGSSSQVAAYSGLVPSERSTGETVSRGRITHQGRSELCGAMVQAAWAVLRTKRDSAASLKHMFYKIMMKRGSQIAIVAVARKLLTIVYHVWREETLFDERKVGRQRLISSKRGSTMDSAADLANVA